MIEKPEAPAIVVGAGPAGLFLAARLAAESGAKVLLLERGPRPGRKLLASGSGQCNITHSGEVEDFLDRYGTRAAGRFLKRALYAFSNADLEAWFLERGLAFETEEGGKVFPSSRRASDVLRLLQNECSARGVELRAGCRVLSASAAAANGGFELELEGGARLRSPLIALAAGGMSYPATGSSGDGYRIAAALGHRIVAPRPALSPVAVRGFALSELAGIGFEDLPFALRPRNGQAMRFRGDLLITHGGFSGPAILDASRFMSSGDILELDFTGRGREAFGETFLAAVSASPRSLVRNALAECGLPKRLAARLCDLAGLDADAACASLRREQREDILRMASSYSAEILELGGFETAMATAGGVALDEADPATMESRLLPGLFFAGEVLDYDGDTGGYNLQAAFSTAAAAARAMARKIVGS
jgi:predicted Rossmann fold flavoprotein